MHKNTSLCKVDKFVKFTFKSRVYKLQKVGAIWNDLIMKQFHEIYRDYNVLKIKLAR